MNPTLFPWKRKAVEDYKEQKIKFEVLLSSLNRTETAKEVMTWCNGYALKAVVSRNTVWSTVYGLLAARVDPDVVFNRLKNGEPL